jgi:phosphoglycolate phosphatase-like HAD superfamily hydrolase
MAAAPAAVNAVAIDLEALADTGPLWRAWLDDAHRRFRVDVTALDDQLPNWRQLLERFAEERAAVYFRRDAAVGRILRTLQDEGTNIGVFTEVPEELARVTLSQVGAARRVRVLETGPGARERLLRRLGPAATVVCTRDQLLAVT